MSLSRAQEKRLLSLLPHQSLPSATLGEMLKLTSEIVWKGTRDELKSYANALACISEIGQSVRVDKVSARDVQGLVQGFRLDGLAPSTINRKLAAFSRVLKVAVDGGFRKERLFMPYFPEPPPRTRVVTEKEEATLLEALEGEDPRCARLVMFLIDTGCRVGEALKGDFDVEGIDGVSWATFSFTKSGRDRRIPLTERALQAARDGWQGPLEVSTGKRGRPRKRGAHGLTYDHLRHVWLKCRPRGDKSFVIHALRHTCASRLLRRGVSIVVVQRWLGHADIKQTLRYSHMSPDMLVDAKKVLE